MNRIHEVPVPRDSDIGQYLDGAYFQDAYETRIDSPGLSALELHIQVMRQTPGWVDRLMTLRNRVVSTLFGLKDLGKLAAVHPLKPAADYRVGDRLGIFVIHSLSDQEVVLTDADRHLDAKVSVRKTGSVDHPTATVSTVVHVHNLLGRLYMLPVAPVHRLIVPAMLRRLAIGAPRPA